MVTFPALGCIGRRVRRFGSDYGGEVTEPREVAVRILLLPPEGVGSLQTVLGSIADHEIPENPALIAQLDHKCWLAQHMADPAVELTQPETDVLLRGLRFTEMMSLDLPFYDALVETVRFVGDRLLALWSPDEWLAFRDL
jgi:hypothetical protein